MNLKTLLATIKTKGLAWKINEYGAIRCCGMCPVSCLDGDMSGGYVFVAKRHGIPLELAYAVAEAADGVRYNSPFHHTNVLRLRKILIKELYEAKNLKRL